MAPHQVVDSFGRVVRAAPPQPLEPLAAVTARPAEPAASVARPSGWRAILSLPLLRRSVILAEIIGQPRSLKGWEH